jgi:nucleoid-associated protein YgaU
MFLSDGTPVRARVEIDLIEATPAGDQISRQTATGNGDREITAGTDDTLTGIATRFYDSPEEWQNIAVASGIENPLADLDGIKLKLGRKNKE